jgi:phosphate transport system permease protein
MGDREFRAFKQTHPAAANVKSESYVYSAGGIWPCIVGTVLLVVGSMSIALFLGVCAAMPSPGDWLQSIMSRSTT